MKKALFFLLGIAVATVAYAYDYPYLTFRTNDGGTKSFSVESITLSIADGRLVVGDEASTMSFEFVDLDRMFFSSDNSGVAESDVCLKSGVVDVYSTSGQYYGRFDSVEQAKASLGSGIYVLKTENGNQKIMVE